jgi:hypothetical protein
MTLAPDIKGNGSNDNVSNCIHEVAGSNLGQHINYPDCGYSSFPSFPSGKKPGNYLKLDHNRLHTNHLEFIIHWHPVI